ncbi:MAG TPA: metal-sulfur cluster assembly factor [Candidatus Absconditabacterales bacterium]|nr:metal-sulfur cluster assembly factor [Candidatus Absconditabacterales bacterium]HMT26727.1 metal-sulfur cluster assembly factor [Candidatus Absconditabacterales bacterium]
MNLENDKALLLIESRLQNVFDPEFPIVDIWTMGLIYAVDYQLDQKKIIITMTLTSPACPAGDQIVGDIKNALLEDFPDFYVQVDITFEPNRTFDMIKDDDLKRMFE